MLYCDDRGQISDQVPLISFLDHGFLFGDSIYEVVRLYEGRLFSWREHRERLLKSAKHMGLQIEALIPEIESRMRKLFKEFSDPSSALRIVITRGGGKLHIDPRTAIKPLVYMAVWNFDKQLVPHQLRLKVVNIRRNDIRSLDPAIKSGNYLNNVLAFKEAVEASYDDAVLLNPRDEITEMTTSNIAWASSDKIFTPAINCGILHGVTRSFFLRSSRVEEGVYTEKELKQADEVFALSTLKELIPVVEVCFSDGEKKKYEAGPMGLQIQKNLRHTIEEEVKQSEKIL